jgi:site-specific DNA recombinase
MSNIELFQKYLNTKAIEKVENRNIVGYTRVSSKQQNENYSLVEQEEEIRQYASKNDYTLLEIYGGTYESASGDFSRKEFKQLFDRVTKASPKPFAIAIKFINRFSRTGASAIGIVHDLVENKGIHLIEANTGLSTENLKERYEIYDKLLKAQVENQERLERTLPGMKKFLMAGNWLGKAPIGYTMRGTRVVDYSLKHHKQEIIINEKGKLLKLAWQWKLEGERDVYIRQRLAELGLLLTNNQLSTMWRKPFYAGVIVNALLDCPVIGHWDSMVTWENFHKINEILNQPQKIKYASDAANIKRPLSRFLICSECGHQLSGYEVKKKGIHYYKCNSCKQATFNAESVGKSRNVGLNNSFNELLGKYTLRKDLEAPFKLQLNKFFKHANVDLFNSISILENEVIECDKKLKALDERYWLSSVTLPVEKYKTFVEQIKIEKAQKELRLADLRKKLSNSEIFVNEAMEIARNVQQYWASSDLESKIKIQKTVFPNGLVIVPSQRRYLTRNVNDFFRRITLFSRALNWSKTKKVAIADDFSFLVAGDGFEPTTFGL